MVLSTEAGSYTLLRPAASYKKTFSHLAEQVGRGSASGVGGVGRWLDAGQQSGDLVLLGCHLSDLVLLGCRL